MTIVMLAHGKDEYIRQAQFSVLSLLRIIGNISSIRVAFYSNKTAELSQFFTGYTCVEFIELSMDTIRRYRGANDFVHRVKVKVLIDAAKRFPGTLVFVDGDTIFQTNPENLFLKINNDVSLFHLKENALNEGRDPLSKKLFRFFRKSTFNVDGREVSVPIDSIMYNTGVIGISKDNQKFLPEVLAFTDVFYAAYPKHIMEQFAFSFVYQKNTQIITAEKEILHYWPEKDRYQDAIDKFLTKYPTATVALENWDDFHLAEAPSASPKPRWSFRSLFAR